MPTVCLKCAHVHNTRNRYLQAKRPLMDLHLGPFGLWDAACVIRRAFAVFRQQRYSCKFAQLGAMRNLAAQAFSQADEFALAPHRALCAHEVGLQGRAVIVGCGMR